MWLPMGLVLMGVRGWLAYQWQAAATSPATAAMELSEKSAHHESRPGRPAEASPGGGVRSQFHETTPRNGRNSSRGGKDLRL